MSDSSIIEITEDEYNKMDLNEYPKPIEFETKIIYHGILPDDIMAMAHAIGIHDVLYYPKAFKMPGKTFSNTMLIPHIEKAIHIMETKKDSVKSFNRAGYDDYGYLLKFMIEYKDMLARYPEAKIITGANL